MAREEIVIVGAGGHGRELFTIAQAAAAAGSPVVPRGIVDDRPPQEGLLEAIGAEYLGTTESAVAVGLAYLVGIGNPATRVAVHERLARSGLEPAAPLVHPRAWVGSSVDLAAGVVLFPFVSITTNVRIGMHTHVCTHAALAHDCVVGGFSSVFPGATVSGSVSIGDRSVIGADATLLQRVSIGTGATVAAGATVIEDVPAGVTVVGTPARTLTAGSSGT